MQTSYFLAAQLCPTIKESFFRFPKRWSPFINNNLYLSLLLYNNTVYLAKELPSFPLPLETWQQTTEHVESLLAKTFLYPKHSSIFFLACLRFQILSLEELFHQKAIEN